LAVTGVVFNHSVDGLLAADILSANSIVVPINEVLYMFRMPALAFLIGLFVPNGVERHGIKGYLRRRVPVLLYLYVLWHLLYGLVGTLAGDAANNQRTWTSMLTIWDPQGPLWFLPFLAVATAVLVVLQPWKPGPRHRASAIGLILLSFVAWAWNPPIAGISGVSLIMFSVAGACLGLTRASRALVASPLKPAAILVLTTATLGLMQLQDVEVVPPTVDSASVSMGVRLASIGFATVGIAMLLAGASLLARVPAVAGALAFVGRRTLEIYLPHTMVAAATRAALVTMGFQDPGLFVAVVLASAIFIPLVVAAAAPRMHAGWLYQLPRHLAVPVIRTSTF
jgi:fucose 4-O-acetylase-like acetyltransferase